MSAAKCARCGHELDAASPGNAPDDAIPQRGDVSVCLYCGNLAVFTGEGLELRAATDEEKADLRSDPEIARIFEAILHLAIDRMEAPCGCRFGTIHQMMVMEPCSDTCDLFAYAVEAFRKRGKPIELVEKAGPWGHHPNPLSWQ